MHKLLLFILCVISAQLSVWGRDGSEHWRQPNIVSCQSPRGSGGHPQSISYWQRDWRCQYLLSHLFSLLSLLLSPGGCLYVLCGGECTIIRCVRLTGSRGLTACGGGRRVLRMALRGEICHESNLTVGWSTIWVVLWRSDLPCGWSYRGVICHDWSLAVTEELAVLMMVSPSW